MENDFDNQKNKRPKHFGLKHKIAAVLLAPLLIAAFISIVSLRADIYSRPQNFKLKHVIAKIAKIFDRHSINSIPLNSARARMAPIEAAIEAYLLNINQYPATLNDLVTNPGLQGWSGPYLKPKQLNDPLDRPYIYIIDNVKNPAGYTLKSYGADGKSGGKGYNADIYND
ncbi:MAG: type II secretion system protein GspG [Sedimentisphaerales bacterium]|nr:type II secretion system protein GspG [Sedimentisphaerales bacterium]